MKWRWLETPPNTGAYNLALDEALLLCLLRGVSPPTFRLSRWTDPHLSIGAFQSAARELNLEEMEKQGVPLVRRSTGGGAVIHEDDLTCSVVAPTQLVSQRAGVKASYQELSLGIRAALARLGADVEIAERWQGERGKGWRGACFASLAPSEITAQGRKLMGHAQWLKGRVYLQQSSLLLKNRQARLASFLKTPGGSGECFFHQLSQQAVGLAELLKDLPSHEEISLAIKEGLEGVLRIDLEQGEVSAQEEKLAQQLINNKYGTPAWSLRL